MRLIAGAFLGGVAANADMDATLATVGATESTGTATLAAALSPAPAPVTGSETAAVAAVAAVG